MAIVKFISDRDCNIFIDKECFGEVTNDSMLKLTLEPGDYLVEVKDKEAHVLKKYNLEIKATDNQILQDVSYGAVSIDDVINQLKNDSSLEFHCNRASFCHNGLYGYVNKRFEVVIPAIYAVANKFKDDKAFVVRDFPEGKKTTLIDKDGIMFFNRWFDYIGESESTILFGVDNKIIVYSKTKYIKEREYINEGYNHKELYVPARKDDSYGLCGYLDFSGNEIIPFIYNGVGNFNEIGESEVNLWGNKIIINIKGIKVWDNSSESMNYSGWEYTPEEIRDYFDEQERGSCNWYGYWSDGFHNFWYWQGYQKLS